MADSQSVQKVQLGCGTLILIALIVLFFSNGGLNRRVDTSQLESDVQQLRSEVRELKQTINDQTEQLKALEQKLENQNRK